MICVKEGRQFNHLHQHLAQTGVKPIDTRRQMEVILKTRFFWPLDCTVLMEEAKNTILGWHPIRGSNWKRGKIGSDRYFVQWSSLPSKLNLAFILSVWNAHFSVIFQAQEIVRQGVEQPRRGGGEVHAQGQLWDEQGGRWSFRQGSLHPPPQFNW